MRTPEGYMIRDDAEWEVKTYRKTGPTNRVKVPIWYNGRARWWEIVMPNIPTAVWFVETYNAHRTFASTQAVDV